VVLGCVGLFLVSIQGFAVTESAATQYGLLPSALARGEYYRLLTAMFLHGNLPHLLINLFFLYTFGDNLEERYGALRYLLLYLACGLVGGLASSGLGLAEQMDTPRIGASGAISGLLGAYLVSFPRTRLVMAIPFFRFLPLVIRWRVWAFLLMWVGLNIIGWTQQQGYYSVDYLAHLGGFVTGVVAGGALVLARQASLVGAEA